MKKQTIKNDFLLKNLKNSINVHFLRKVSKSPVFISKDTGLVYHSDILSSKETVRRWSNKIFNKKNNPKNEIYTADFPGMQSRHYFVIDYLRRNVNLKNKNICDFACGEGSILIKLQKYFGYKKLVGTEHSKKNIDLVKKIFKKNKLKTPKLFQCSIEDLNKVKSKSLKIDVGILTWTLCNCSEPLDVVESLSKNIKKNGFLVVAESSRILVPFKKPIQNYFNKKKLTGNYHPWHWSYNSLTNIFKAYGFELISSNRYWDEDNLILIFKNSKLKQTQFRFDNYKKVSDFFLRWFKESLKYSKNKNYFV
tara:strand:+ start:2328 stop:3251 length:924 start_codon:yes stop_codon:yes gene_type:complete